MMLAFTSCQVQDKAEKQAAEARSVIKNIGDRIKASMVICKRAGMWEVPPGSRGEANVAVLVFSSGNVTGNVAERTESIGENISYKRFSGVLLTLVS